MIVQASPDKLGGVLSDHAPKGDERFSENVIKLCITFQWKQNGNTKKMGTFNSLIKAASISHGLSFNQNETASLPHKNRPLLRPNNWKPRN